MVRDRGARSLLELLEIRVRMWDAEDASLAVPRHPDVDSPLDGERARAEESAARLGVTAANPREIAAARRARLRARGWTPAALRGAACAGTGAEPADVSAGARRHAVSRARAIVAYVAGAHLAWPTLEVARAVGVTASSAVEARSRGAVVLARAGVTAREVLRIAGVPD